MLKYDIIVQGENIGEIATRYGILYTEYENKLSSNSIAKIHEVYDFLSMSDRRCWLDTIDELFRNTNNPSTVVSYMYKPLNKNYNFHVIYSLQIHEN